MPEYLLEGLIRAEVEGTTPVAARFGTVTEPGLLEVVNYRRVSNATLAQGAGGVRIVDEIGTPREAFLGFYDYGVTLAFAGIFEPWVEEVSIRGYEPGDPGKLYVRDGGDAYSSVWMRGDEWIGSEAAHLDIGFGLHQSAAADLDRVLRLHAAPQCVTVAHTNTAGMGGGDVSLVQGAAYRVQDSAGNNHALAYLTGQDQLRLSGGGTSAIQGRGKSLANGATAPLADWCNGNMRGLLFVGASNARSAIFDVNGGDGVVNKLADARGGYSNTGGSAGLVNVYWNGGTGQYEVQNLTGGAVDLSIIYIGY